MENPFSMPSDLVGKMMVVCPVDDPSPVMFLNVYESGDVWLKTQGCEACSEESKELCCRGCPMATPKGCLLHLTNVGNSDKPFRCIKNPYPNNVRSWCAIEFTCIHGSNKGAIRRVREPDTVRKND